MTEKRRGDWIQTFTGRQFWPLDPRPEDVDIEDIAHALSNVCRFTGHVREFYSVAQHAVLVSSLVPAEHALWGLLHDASEAYIADVASPLKVQEEMAPYRAIERGIMDAVCARFGLAPREPDEVKHVDRRLLATEARDLMPPHAVWANLGKPYRLPLIVPWPPGRAKVAFLSLARDLGAVASARPEDARERARAAWDTWTDEDRNVERAAAAALRLPAEVKP